MLPQVNEVAEVGRVFPLTSRVSNSSNSPPLEIVLVSIEYFTGAYQKHIQLERDH